MTGDVPCPDCDGTGAEEPGCRLCKDARCIPLWKAYFAGYRKTQLENVYDDDCECPRCGGEPCEYCEGSGVVPAWSPSVEQVRVLRYGIEGEIPPLINPETGRAYTDALLSRAAASECRKRGEISWLCTVFGDEVSLTPDGYRAALALYDDGTSRFMTPTTLGLIVGGYDAYRMQG